MSGTLQSTIAREAAEIAERAETELARLVDVSSPSGDVPGAEAAIAVCVDLLPDGAEVQRPPCSTAGSAPDLIATVRGTGQRRIMLLGHVDTVVGHDAHQPLRADGERLYGSGTVDMKGGDILALGVARALARSPETFAELSVLMVCDEEWRVAPFSHVERFAGYDACLCFEAGHLTAGGDEGVVVRRKAAGTLIVDATGRASHSGAAPDQGRNALLALARVATQVAEFHDLSGPEQLSVVPTVIRSGDAFNVVPAAGELICDMRARTLEAFEPVLGSVPAELDEVRLEARMGRSWPGMDAVATTAPVLEGAARRLGRPIVGVPRGGASDASHFAASIPLTIDGLGPRGGGAHTPEEFALREALALRAEVALAIGHELLAADGGAGSGAR
jgi:glutamate carboxypeptidase